VAFGGECCVAEATGGLGRALLQSAESNLDTRCERIVDELVGTTPRDDVFLVIARYEGYA
jgi:hypothetical protein